MLPSGTTAMQTNMIQCAAYGLSTDRLTPHPFNLCSNAGSTRMSIYQRQPQDMTLSMCTMVRTVLSGTCLVKPLYGLGHRAAAQFQVVGNLLIASAIFTEAHCIHWIKKNLTPYLVIMRKDLIITRKDLVIKRSGCRNYEIRKGASLIANNIYGNRTGGDRVGQTAV